MDSSILVLEFGIECTATGLVDTPRTLTGRTDRSLKVASIPALTIQAQPNGGRRVRRFFYEACCFERRYGMKIIEFRTNGPMAVDH
jgi:hypothetical protein